MPTNLHGKVVLITGASSGFGRDAAHLFAQEGCKVVLAARRLDRLQALAEEIQQQGGEALAVPVDLTVLEEIYSMVATVMEIYERVDILFNNAGFGGLGYLEELEPNREIQTQIAVNLTGLIQVTRAVLPHMIARRQGHIINMVSVSAWIPAPTYTIYAATKSGVCGFNNALRREVVRHNLRVSAIYPAPSKTEFSWNQNRRQRKPGWFKFIFIPPASVSQRVVELARSPRRSVTMPGWFALIGFFDLVIPGIVDWFVKILFTNRLKDEK